MRIKHFLASVFLLVAPLAFAATAGAKTHVISFGKWITAPWLLDGGTPDDKPLTIKVRALMVDGRAKEFVLGPAHDVTDRLFVVRRAFRINDSLPEDSTPRWQWQRGGWLLVDRMTGRVSAIALPEFDAFYSAASWYRDYAAYCGVSDDGKKTFAMVTQVGRKKPVLKKQLSNDGLSDEAAPDSACPAPAWQRLPARVSFAPEGGAKQTFAVRGHVVDMISNSEEDEEASK